MLMCEATTSSEVMSDTLLAPAGVNKGNAMRSILLDLLSDTYQSSLPDKGAIPLPRDVVRFRATQACTTHEKVCMCSWQN